MAIGSWWIPGSGEVGVPGTLGDGEHGRLVVETAGTLALRADDSLTGEVAEHAAVYGVQDGVEYTLCDCMEMVRNLREFGVRQSVTAELHPQLVFVGPHLESGASTRWSQFHLEVNGLTHWLQGGGIRPAGRPGHRQALVYTPPDHPVVDLTAGRLEIWRGLTTRNSGAKSEMTEKALIVLELREPASFWNAWKDVIVRLDSFFRFTSGGLMAVSAISAQPDGSDGHTWYEIRGTGMTAPTIDTSLAPDHFLIDHRRLGQRALELLVNWVAEEQRSAIDIVVGLLDDSPKYQEVRFLTIMAAFEAFHRSFLDHPDIPPDEHRLRRDAVLQSVPDEYRDWVQSRLINSNQPNFKMRLTEVLEMADEWTVPLAGDVQRFVSRVGNTRNYFVHQDPEGRRSAETDPERLYWTNRVLSVSLELAIGLQFGLTADEMRSQLRMNRRYLSAREHLQKHPLFPPP